MLAGKKSAQMWRTFCLPEPASSILRQYIHYNMQECESQYLKCVIINEMKM
jgi:hypothetical protein